MSGYDCDRMVGVSQEQLDEVSCAICHGVFNDPVTVDCCQQSFCRQCITQWISTKNICPTDRTTLTRDMLKPVPKALKNLIQQFGIKCIYESDGCSMVATIGTLDSHLNTCQFKSNTECKICGLIRESVVNHDCVESLSKENLLLKLNAQEQMDEDNITMMQIMEGFNEEKQRFSEFASVIETKFNKLIKRRKDITVSQTFTINAVSHGCHIRVKESFDLNTAMLKPGIANRGVGGYYPPRDGQKNQLTFLFKAFFSFFR